MHNSPSYSTTLVGNNTLEVRHCIEQQDNTTNPPPSTLSTLLFSGKVDPHTYIDSCVAHFERGTQPYLCVFEYERSVTTTANIQAFKLPSTVVCTSHNLATLALQKITVGTREEGVPFTCVPSEIHGVFIHGVSGVRPPHSPLTSGSALSHSPVNSSHHDQAGCKKSNSNTKPIYFMGEALISVPNTLHLGSPARVDRIFVPIPHHQVVSDCGADGTENIRGTTLNFRPSNTSSAAAEINEDDLDTNSNARPSSNVVGSHLRIIGDMSAGEAGVGIALCVDNNNSVSLKVLDRRMVGGLILRKGCSVAAQDVEHDPIDVRLIGGRPQLETHTRQESSGTATLFIVVRSADNAFTFVGIASLCVPSIVTVAAPLLTTILNFTIRPARSLVTGDSSVSNKCDVSFSKVLLPIGWSPLVLIRTTTTISALTCTQLQRLLFPPTTITTHSTQQPAPFLVAYTDRDIDANNNSNLPIEHLWINTLKHVMSLRRCAHTTTALQIVQRALVHYHQSSEDIVATALVGIANHHRKDCETDGDVPSTDSSVIWDSFVGATLSWAKTAVEGSAYSGAPTVGQVTLLLVHLHFHAEVRRFTSSPNDDNTAYLVNLSNDLLHPLAALLKVKRFTEFYECTTGATHHPRDEVSSSTSEEDVSYEICDHLPKTSQEHDYCLEALLLDDIRLLNEPPSFINTLTRPLGSGGGRSLERSFEAVCGTSVERSAIHLLGRLRNLIASEAGCGGVWWETLVELAADIDYAESPAQPTLTTLAANLPLGAAHIFRKAKYLATESPPSRWFASSSCTDKDAAEHSNIIAHSIGRWDKIVGNVDRYMNNTPKTNRGSAALAVLRQLQADATNGGTSTSTNDDVVDDDGVQLPKRLSVLPAPQWPDSRLDLTQTLLNSTRSITLQSKVGQELEVHLQGLSTALRQQLALPFGRALLTLSTQLSTPTMREIIPIPPLVVKGFTAEGVAVKVSDIAEVGLSTEDLWWAEFHNGCAAGLRYLSRDSNVTSGWIRYQCRDRDNPGRPGVLLSVGLLGHINKMTSADVFSLLVGGHAKVTIAYILGLGCAERGRPSDQGVGLVKTHIRFLNDVNDQQPDMPTFVEYVGIVSLGLMHQGTQDRLFSTALFEQIVRLPSDEHSSNRSAYALCAGISLGLVMLGTGKLNKTSNSTGQQLLELLETTKRASHDTLNTSSADHLLYWGPPPIRYGRGECDAYLGGTGGMDNVLLRYAVQSGSQPTPVSCTTIFEGPHLNRDIVGPAACAALLLIYATSNDRSVADRLRPVADGVRGAGGGGGGMYTHGNHIESQTPIIVLLRVLTANMVMWDSISPTTQWLYGGTSFDSTLLGQFILFEGNNDDYNPIPIKNPAMIPEFCNAREKYHLLCLAHAIAGSCLALGLRYAGSGNLEARDLVLEELSGFSKGFVGRSRIKLREGVSAIEDCVSSCLSAVGLIMSGTGDTTTLTALQNIMNDKKKAFSHSAYIAASQAVGMLFLAGGTQTFSNDIESLAPLFISTFPMWTSGILGGGLSVLRHLHILAAFPRRVEVRDANTNTTLPAEIRIASVSMSGMAGSSSSVNLSTPSVLPPLETIERIEVRTWQHYPVTLTRTDIETLTNFGRMPLQIRVLKRISGDQHGSTNIGRNSDNQISSFSSKEVSRCDVNWVQSEILCSISSIRKVLQLPAHTITATNALDLLTHAQHLQLIYHFECATNGVFVGPDVKVLLKQAIDELQEPLIAPRTRNWFDGSNNFGHVVGQVTVGGRSVRVPQLALIKGKPLSSEAFRIANAIGHPGKASIVALWLNAAFGAAGLNDVNLRSQICRFVEKAEALSSSSTRIAINMSKECGIPLKMARSIALSATMNEKEE